MMYKIIIFFNWKIFYNNIIMSQVDLEDILNEDDESD